MANHASHAALPYPIKGARFTLLLPYLDADGDPTAPTTPDTEISEDNAAATDCAEEASATSGMDGMAMLTLSGAETDCSILALNAKVASGPKATLAMLSPRALASVGTGTLSAGSAGGGTLGTILAYDVTGCFIKTTGGTGGGGTGGANNQARRIITYVTSTGAFTVEPSWETTPDNTTTYTILLPEGVTLGMLRALNPATPGRPLVVDAAGLADVNVVKAGPSGSGVAVSAWSATRGLAGTALPNAAADAAGGLPISDAGGLDLDAQIGTDIDAILVDTGTTLDGRIPAALGANGNIKADVRDFGGTAGTNSAGRPEVNTTHLAGTAYATAAAALVQAVWDAATSALTAVGSIGKKLADWTIHSAADVWAAATRTLTAGTNIALAKGTGVTGFTDLSAADVRTALGLASANLDTQLDALPTNDELATALAAADDAVLAAIAALSIPTAAANASAVWAAATRTLTANTNFNDPTAATIAAAVVAETITELASVPGASPTLKQALALLYMALRNKVLSGASLRIHNDAGTIVATKVQTDNGTFYQEDKAT